MNIDLSKLNDVTLASIVADLHCQHELATMFQVSALLTQRVGAAEAAEMVGMFIAANDASVANIMEWVVADE